MFDDLFEHDSFGERTVDVDPLEVQRVIAALDDLIRTVDDETVKVYLHAACEDVNNLLAAGEEDYGWAEAA
jgi:hypothetical protein